LESNFKQQPVEITYSDEYVGGIEIYSKLNTVEDYSILIRNKRGSCVRE